MALTGEYVPSTSSWAADQVALFESTNGAEGNTLKGKPIVVITTVGAKSGKLRKNPVMRVEYDGQYAAVGSQGGAPDDPDWAHNLRAHPECELQDGPEKHTYTAHVSTGAERALWWARAEEAWPDYASYAEKTDREIPVFVLTRKD